MVLLDSNADRRCTRCGKDLLITDNSTGERFCSGCGFVIVDRLMDSGSETRAFTKEEYDDRARTGMPASLAVHDMGLATMIGHERTDAMGKPLSSSMKYTMNRLRTWDNRSKATESADKNLRQAFSELNRLRDKLALSDAVIEKTAYIYRKGLERGLTKGRSISGLIAAALYMACRESCTPRTLNEIAHQINIKRKDISRSYRLLCEELDMTMPVLDPIRCMSRIASQAGLGEKVKRKALAILQEAGSMELTAGKDPMGLAAAALYLSCTINRDVTTQKIIALAAGVTEVTIRNRYKHLKESLNILIQGQ
jgi:transcription initiation factor TFIIB